MQDIRWQQRFANFTKALQQLQPVAEEIIEKIITCYAPVFQSLKLTMVALKNNG